MKNIKNIILDLGGVLINLDYPATGKKFREFGLTDFDSLFTQAKQTTLFDDYETGKISSKQFIEELNNYTGNKLSPEQITEAWNAMLLDFPENRMELIEELSKNYNLFLLSNTNHLHIQEFEKILNQTFSYSRFLNGFNKVYYSYEVGLRKPHREIFKLVLNENNLNAHETLFIDDSPQHINGAIGSGINAHWLDLNKEDIHHLLKRLGIHG